MPTISELTYGRSDAGRKNFIQVYTGWAEKTKQSVRGNSYTAVVNAINKGWSGSDADAFLVALDKFAKQLETRISGYASKMNSTMANDASSFSSMQNANANSINNMRF